MTDANNGYRSQTIRCMDDGDLLVSERMIRNCEALNLTLP